MVHAYELLHPALDGNLEKFRRWIMAGCCDWDGMTIHFFFQKMDSTMGKIAIEPSFGNIFMFFSKHLMQIKVQKHVDSFITSKTKMAGWKIHHE